MLIRSKLRNDSPKSFYVSPTILRHWYSIALPPHRPMGWKHKAQSVPPDGDFGSPSKFLVNATSALVETVSKHLRNGNDSSTTDDMMGSTAHTGQQADEDHNNEAIIAMSAVLVVFLALLVE